MLMLLIPVFGVMLVDSVVRLSSGNLRMGYNYLDQPVGPFLRLMLSGVGLGVCLFTLWRTVRPNTANDGKHGGYSSSFPIVLLLFLAATITILFTSAGPRRNPAFEEAIVQARASLTNFISVVQMPKTNQMTFVVLTYLPSKPSGAPEGVWIRVNKYDGQSFSGYATTDDNHVGLKLNQPVSVDVSNVFDWMYLDSSSGHIEVVGNFTGKAVH